MTEQILLSPPIAFIVLLLLLSVLSLLFSRLAFRKRQNIHEAEKAYACGENFEEHMIQPDYSQFFPYAFFFTILHVVALVIATVPTETIETFFVVTVYVVGAVIGLFILMRK
jgi:NADH:ubiquinone oxidoreductase subunit 3 (subunit A)